MVTHVTTLSHTPQYIISIISERESTLCSQSVKSKISNQSRTGSAGRRLSFCGVDEGEEGRIVGKSEKGKREERVGESVCSGLCVDLWAL